MAVSPATARSPGDRTRRTGRLVCRFHSRSGRRFSASALGLPLGRWWRGAAPGPGPRASIAGGAGFGCAYPVAPGRDRFGVGRCPGGVSPRLARYGMSRLYPVVRARPAGTLPRVPAPRRCVRQCPEAAPTHGERGRAGVSPQDERATTDPQPRRARVARAEETPLPGPADPPAPWSSSRPAPRTGPHRGRVPAPPEGTTRTGSRPARGNGPAGPGSRPAPRRPYRRWEVSFRRRTEALPSA
ncbi:hypothetical protein BCL76_102481 [Streptomyces sp. CG 926]|nr:hypothetical protein BCL76_102481 [Streptomyces sp. CG 926]